MNVLSLFDGISCGQVALRNAGVSYNKYFSSEIDRHAIRITNYNFPDTIQIGGVESLKAENLPKIDLLMGGSPCQGFSGAGRGLNFDDPRSKLFFEFVRLKKESEPAYFFLENVNMKKEWRDIISEHLEIEPINVNSAIHSAQNRNRWYWTNIPYSHAMPTGETLGDILEISANVDRDDIIFDDTFFHSSTGKRSRDYVRQGLRFPDQKARCLTRSNTAAARSTGGTCVPMVRPDGKIIWRDLTLTECERLQGLPDGYTNVPGVPKTARGQAIGNGWNVPTIVQFFKSLSVDK